MANRILSQNRGKGVPKCLAKNKKSKIGENHYEKWMEEGYKVNSFINSGNHSGLFMKISSLKDKTLNGIILAPRDIRTGLEVKDGIIGTITHLKDLGVSTEIMNIEFSPGSKSRIARAAGTSFSISSKTEKAITLLSKKRNRKIILDPNCRCMIGSVAGGDRKDIPLLRAGKKVNCSKKKAYGVSPNKMNAVDHPFGGNSPGCGRNKEIKRTASPGMKVGNIAPSRSGIRKKKR